jgi:hypothetical protein
MTDWQKVTAGLDHGGYAAWEAALAEPGHDIVPVFFQLVSPADAPMTLADAISATLALPDVFFSQHERDLLQTELAVAGMTDWPNEVRGVAFCPRAALAELPAFWNVLQVGPGLAMPMRVDRAPGRNLRLTEGNLAADVPVLAVIDDGIGFLNARFRRSKTETRFKAVWMQAPDRLDAPEIAPREDIVCGRVLSEADINAHLRAGGDEAETYRQINRALLPVTERAMTNRRIAHGTHVLDLAAGVNPAERRGKPADPVMAVPLLAVQLPPASIRETSGRRMEAYLVQGLRWIMAEVLRQAHLTDVPPLVINLSVGSLGGPGDETAFLADWFRYEIARHARLADAAEVRLVVAYGNARKSRLVARSELRRSNPMRLDWRVQPDDHSSSFLELRVDAGMLEAGPEGDQGLIVELTPPVASGLPSLSVPWPAPREGWRLATDDGPIAAMTSVAEQGGQALLHLSLAPSAGAKAVAPSGGWRLMLKTIDAEPLRVTARVQRDETPPSYVALGRQSWLDHPKGWDWDPEDRAYTAPRSLADATGCPVTRESTGVAYAGSGHPSILFVGAVRPAPTAERCVRPMGYSAEGARHLVRHGESLGPTLVAFGDDGTALPGRMAAGVLSGSVARMSGTSMAAPSVARALLCYFLKTPRAKQTLDAERMALTGDADWSLPDPRLGHGVLVGAY